MTTTRHIKKLAGGHGIILLMILCLFGLFLWQSVSAASRRHRKVKQDDRVYLIHSDELRYDMYGPNPMAQIVKGHVAFRHQGARLTCDSAYFFQESNSVKAFGHVRFVQGDTLSLTCQRASYDGESQMMQARQKVVLTHRRQVLHTDSLDYDRLYNNAYFFEGGTLIDGKDRLVSDWGEYHLDTREAVFYYNVKLRSPDRVITTDTLHYDTRKSIAHIVGPNSKITSKESVVNTSDAYFNTRTNKAQLYSRSTMVDKDKTITGDSLFYDKNGESYGYGNVIYVDKRNKNSLKGGYLQYNEKTGYGFATKDALVEDFSQKDTLYMHADTLKIFTYNINTDSVYRVIHAYKHVRAFRTDVQAVCDSMVFNSKDTCMTMYQDPVVWNANRQLLGEKILVFLNDSTVRQAHVIGQAFSIEKVDEKNHFNQISSKEMIANFVKGALRRSTAIGTVKSVNFPRDDKDSTLIGLNHLETDTMRLYIGEDRKLEKIWTNKFESVMYPMTQIPPSELRLPGFAWFEDIRPKDKTDVFVWKSKGDNNLKKVERHEAPLQRLGGKGTATNKGKGEEKG